MASSVSGLVKQDFSQLKAGQRIVCQEDTVWVEERSQILSSDQSPYLPDIAKKADAFFKQKYNSLQLADQIHFLMNAEFLHDKIRKHNKKFELKESPLLFLLDLFVWCVTLGHYRLTWELLSFKPFDEFWTKVELRHTHEQGAEWLKACAQLRPAFWEKMKHADPDFLVNLIKRVIGDGITLETFLEPVDTLLLAGRFHIRDIFEVEHLQWRKFPSNKLLISVLYNLMVFQDKFVAGPVLCNPLIVKSVELFQGDFHDGQLDQDAVIVEMLAGYARIFEKAPPDKRVGIDFQPLTQNDILLNLLTTHPHLFEKNSLVSKSYNKIFSNS